VSKSVNKSTPAIALALLALLHGTPALAQNLISFVSNSGDDGNNCRAIISACASFQHAHDVTASGGEIIVLNAGEYDRVVINRSIHITNDGVGTASVSSFSSGQSGIDINAGAGDVVGLRGLAVDGRGAGRTGIDIATVSAVHIQNCVIRNFQGSGPSAGFGIALEPTGSTQLFVSDTLIYNNGSTADSGGILIDAGGQFAGVKAVLERVHVENNVIGIKVDGTGSFGNGFHVTVRNSEVSGNVGTGIWSARFAGHNGLGSSPTVVVVDGTGVANNAGAGVLADGGAVVLLRNSTVEYNGTGASVANGGRLFTYGNNLVDNNAGEDLSPAAVARSSK